MVRYGPVWRDIGVGVGGCFEEAARPEVIFGNFRLLLLFLCWQLLLLLLRLIIVGLTWRFRWYTQSSTITSIAAMEGTEWSRLCTSLDIGHSNRSTSTCEVTAEAGCSFMFLAQIRPFSRCTIFSSSMMLLL